MAYSLRKFEFANATFLMKSLKKKLDNFFVNFKQKLKKKILKKLLLQMVFWGIVLKREYFDKKNKSNNDH